MEEFRNQLVSLFNGSQLPFEAKFYVVKDVFRDIEAVYRQHLTEMELSQVSQKQEEKDGVQQCS